MQTSREANELIIMDDKPSMRRLGFDKDDNDDDGILLKVLDDFRFY